jgi:hypothetical protein
MQPIGKEGGMVLRMDMVFTIVAAILLGVLQAYSGRLQATTLWAGGKLKKEALLPWWCLAE